MKEIIIGFCLAIILVNIVNFIMILAGTGEKTTRLVNAPIALGIFYVIRYIIRKIVLLFGYCFCPCIFFARYGTTYDHEKSVFIITKNLWQFLAVKKRLSKKPWKNFFYYSKLTRPDAYKILVSGKYKNVIYA